jgi:hypothetical protein
MIIHCTRALLKELGSESPPSPDADPFFSWHAKVMQFSSGKGVAFVHDATRYTLIAHDLAEKDFGRLGSVFFAALRDRLADEGLNPETVERYIMEGGAAEFEKTKSRSLVSQLNHSCANAAQHFRSMQKGALAQRSSCRKANSELARSGEGAWAQPKKSLCDAFVSRYGDGAIRCHAVELRVRLDLFKNEVWREILVPMHYTFSELHAVIQTAFDWQGGAGVHDFYIFDGDSIVANVVSEQAASGGKGGPEAVLESDALLRDYLPRYEIVYRYDFREDWTHMIEARGVIANYGALEAVCTAGHGHRPPENAGFGAYGFEEFLRIMLGSGASNEPSVDLEGINYRLKYERNSH